VTEPLKIGIILSTSRPARFADRPARWLIDLARRRDQAAFEIVDLRDYPLPFFDEDRLPMWAPAQDPIAARWARKMAELDGYIFVTAEYNHGIPAVLKNALDHAYGEYNRKPATFLGYGSAGGARAIEQLRLVLAELQVATLRNSVHVNAVELAGMLMQGRTFDDYPYLEQTAIQMLDELLWWAQTLKAGRDLALARHDESAALNPPLQPKLRIVHEGARTSEPWQSRPSARPEERAYSRAWSGSRPRDE
jgi:NAD(P)H-dependent FMN reductase